MSVIGIVHAVHEWFRRQLDGSRDAGRNCTMASGSMALYRHSNGRLKVSPQRLRDVTGDHVGGTNLDQLRSAFVKLGYGAGWSPVYRGLAIRTFYAMLRSGRAAVVQGSSRATYGTKWRASFTFRGNHSWYVLRGKDWDSLGRPAYLRIADPLRDGRQAGIGSGFFWLPRSYFEKFLAYLDFGYETLGFGKAYALFTRDTNPHVHRTVSGIIYVRRRFALRSGHTIRRRPGGEIIRRTLDTDVLDVWGYIENGPSFKGSRRWYCDHSGTRWVHSSARKL